MPETSYGHHLQRDRRQLGAPSDNSKTKKC
jgi:hypothetical protein